MDLSALTVSEIKHLADQRVADGRLAGALLADARVAVRQIGGRLCRRLNEQQRENERLTGLWCHEKELYAQGFVLPAGVDEAGRGPLAGPVVAAAVILPAGVSLPGLNDSKKLSAGKREALAWQIKKMSLAWSVGLATVAEIERINIHRASLLAMWRAVNGLAPSPQFLLVDGRHAIDIDLPQRPLVGGDGLSASIAAASILAKMTRDHLMQALDRLYPPYGFAVHKGYPTPEHLQALDRFGPCALHRAGFKPVRAWLEAHGQDD
ncbi:ribonuclease HII [Desulfotomaculum copahuensis]|uniref:Ribonuclease HII n=1 Tax=Desulfotomaculum copahuensis TaxID=1838280 RepID=A0A1B7LB28_9FIRM|nr:ribonuclease HII [Desulfotomaculum copahuensis]OAT79510.1 ribonuclease HII [Desulfotomaculum copahuensis]